VASSLQVIKNSFAVAASRICDMRKNAPKPFWPNDSLKAAQCTDFGEGRLAVLQKR
jgi:hypothetical protein